MKNLKFTFVLFLVAGIVSCSSDDDSNDLAEGNRIVGEWRIQSQTIDGEAWELSDCELQSRINFSANGNVTVRDFYEDFETEECVSEVYNQRWEYRGNNVYRITEGNMSQDVTIIFSNNNNTFTISVQDDDGEYSATYVRV